jgi:hypothetical protein
MTDLIISDSQLAEQVRRLAERENRSIEDVLRAALAQYTAPSTPPLEAPEAQVRAYRQKLYAEARRYWQATSNAERLALSDAELDEQFWLFDAEGVPRLKVDEGTFAFEENWTARFVRLAQASNVHLGSSFDPADADDILNAEFADYLLDRMQQEHGSEENSG